MKLTVGKSLVIAILVVLGILAGIWYMKKGSERKVDNIPTRMEVVN